MGKPILSLQWFSTFSVNSVQLSGITMNMNSLDGLIICTFKITMNAHRNLSLDHTRSPLSHFVHTLEELQFFLICCLFDKVVHSYECSRPSNTGTLWKN